MNSTEFVLERTDLARPNSGFAVLRESGVCEACGGVTPFEFKQIINDTLARQWRLEPQVRKAFSARESMFCAFCGCSYRLRALAQALVVALSEDAPSASLTAAIENGKADGKKVAEINSCGVLHEILKTMPDLSYSEYASMNPDVRSEDLQKLTYKTNSFDVVLTSDTLEHVPDVDAALREIYRVLKPGGAHIFTVPLRLDVTKTRQRVKLNKETGEMKQLLAPSFHGSGEPDYLVQNEFGFDFIERVERAGFYVRLSCQNPANLADPSGVLVAIKNKAAHADQTLYADEAYADATGRTKIKATKRAIKPFPARIIDEKVQTCRVASLANKLALTTQHAVNLQQILNGHIDELTATQARLAATTATLLETRRQLDRTLGHRIRSRVRKLGRQAD